MNDADELDRHLRERLRWRQLRAELERHGVVSRSSPPPARSRVDADPALRRLQAAAATKGMLARRTGTILRLT
jgi:hypothetical protein